MNIPNYQQYGNYPQQNYQQMYQPQPLQQMVYQNRNDLHCRMVNSQNDIRVEEIPMDGTVGIFPVNNMSEIYAKSWNSITGSIDTVVYKPALQEETKLESKNNLDDFVASFNLFKDEVMDRLERIAKNIPKQNRNQNNKEVNK